MLTTKQHGFIDMKSISTTSLIFSCMLVLLVLPLHAAAAEEPTDIFALRQEAERAYNDRDAEKAKVLFLQLTENFPDEPDAWYGLSRAYEWGGDLDKSIDAAERVQDLGYFSAAYLSHRLAKLNALAGNTDDALRWLARALQEGYGNRPSLQSNEAFVSLDRKSVV